MRYYISVRFNEIISTCQESFVINYISFIEIYVLKLVVCKLHSIIGLLNDLLVK